MGNDNMKCKIKSCSLNAKGICKYRKGVSWINILNCPNPEANPNAKIEHEYTSEIVCPYCGHEFINSWEVGYGEQDLGDIDCPECEKTFLAYKNIEITYNTIKKEDNDRLMHRASIVRQ